MAVLIKPSLNSVVASALGNFTATCTVSEAVGDVVYRSSATGVLRCDPTNSLKMPGVGVIISKQSSTTCTVQPFGPVNLYSGLSVGRLYAIGLDGRPFLGVFSLLGGQTAFLQVIGTALDTSTLLISPNSQLTMIRG